MKLKTKLLALFSLLYLSFSIVVWVYSHTISTQINEQWSTKFIHHLVYFDKHRTLKPIVREIGLIRSLAHEPSILQMALNESNTTARANGLATLEAYRTKFQDQSYFIALSLSENYYFNDPSNRYHDQQPSYTLSRENPKDQWFYATIAKNDEYEINVNQDSILGTTKVWINYLLKHDGKTIGVIGTGLDLTAFLKETVGINHEGIRTVLINKELSIQLDHDINLIDYASISKRSGEHQTLSLILDDKETLKNIRDAISHLQESVNSSEVKILWTKIANKEHIIGIAYLKEVRWYSVSIIDADELMIIDDQSVFWILTLLFLVAISIVMIVYHFFIFKPLDHLQASIEKMEKGHYDKDFTISGSEEIVRIADTFKKMADSVCEYHKQLEEKIEEQVQTHEALMESESEKRKKDKIITIQSQFASTGKVIGNIIHQWKIPLVRAGTHITEIETLIHLTPQNLIEEIQEIIPRLRKDFSLMKHSIDEFQSLYLRDSDLSEFNPIDTLKGIWSMLEGKVLFCNATVSYEQRGEIPFIRGHEHFFAHISMIIIDNMLNIAHERRIKSPHMRIRCETISTMVMISFDDNVGGIFQKPITSIFEFDETYYDSKNKSKGLGLHTAQFLMKEKFDGAVYAENTSEGACFTLIV